MRILVFSVFSALALTLGGCGTEEEATHATSSQAASVDVLAERYVRLALAFGRHDSSYVDAYFGPEEWRAEALAEEQPLTELRAAARDLHTALEAHSAESAAEIEALRVSALSKRVSAMLLRMDMVEQRFLRFDDESRILFDATAPDNSEEHFRAIISKVEALVPGDGPLAERVETFRQEFVIPPDRLSPVFDAAIAECRRRTLRHIELPPSESFEIEFVTDQPWSGYNWYKGKYFSLIQINTDLPIFIDRAVDLGCHEGYPGHHTYNVLIERDLVNTRGWIEFTLNPLYGPQSLISEGSANYGIELAFPGTQRARFEREVLFPLAGLDPDAADRYYALSDLSEQLAYAGNEAARDYLNGDISAAEAAEWLVTYTLTSPERATQRVRFFDTYRSYVINYNLGKDLVDEYIETRAGDDPDSRWNELARILSTPVTPSELLR